MVFMTWIVLSPPGALYACLNICIMETIHPLLLFFEQNQVWLIHGRKSYYDHSRLNSKFIEKNDILWVDNLKVIILSVIIRNFVLFCKPILVLNCHSLKHKPVISWNINHRYNFSLTSAIKQDIWYAFSKVSTLSIKI